MILLFEFGGCGAVLLLALFGIGKWFLKKMNAALDSYVAAYAQQTANIDARIANLEKLAQEQAHLTRTVERIKDEIAAQAKSRDNMWEFRKDVYISLISGIEQILSLNATAFNCLSQNELIPPEMTAKLFDAVKQFSVAANLAPLAASDDVLPLVKSSLSTFKLIKDPGVTLSLESIRDTNLVFIQLRDKIQAAGRKDLWGTPEPGAPTTTDARVHRAARAEA
jgi:cell division protein FtsB